jgi:hypothetical protein
LVTRRKFLNLCSIDPSRIVLQVLAVQGLGESNKSWSGMSSESPKMGDCMVLKWYGKRVRLHGTNYCLLYCGHEIAFAKWRKILHY